MSRDYNIILILFDLVFSNLITYESTINSKEVIAYPHGDLWNCQVDNKEPVNNKLYTLVDFIHPTLHTGRYVIPGKRFV